MLNHRLPLVVLAALAAALVGGCEQGYMGRYEVRLSVAVTRLKVDVREARTKILDLVDRFAQAQGLTPNQIDGNRSKPILLLSHSKPLPEGPLLSIQVYEGDQPNILWVDVTELWAPGAGPETQRVERELSRALEEAVGKEAVTRLGY